jgi:hypothetical protein
MTKNNQTNSTQQKITLKPIVSPETIKGFYANNIQLTLQNEELIIDCVNFHIRNRTAVPGSRIYLSPIHTKRLYKSLEKLVEVRNQKGAKAKVFDQTGEIGYYTH